MKKIKYPSETLLLVIDSLRRSNIDTILWYQKHRGAICITLRREGMHDAATAITYDNALLDEARKRRTQDALAYITY